MRVRRCADRACRAVVVLLPAWMSVRVGATLLEIERVVEAREAGATRRKAARAAGIAHAPAKQRAWQRRFEAVMEQLLPRIPGLSLEHGPRWMRQLRRLLGVEGASVLEALRWRLYREDGTVLGPLYLVTLDRARARGPPSP